MSLANQLTALLSQRDEVADKAVMLGATLPENPTLKQIADALDALIRIYIPAYAAVYGGDTLVFGRGKSAPASYEDMILTAAFDDANGYNIETDLYGFDQDTGGYTTPWYSYRTKITSVDVVDEIKPARTSYWFAGLSKCTDWELSNLNTSQVEYMVEMFANTGGLAEDDLLGLNVSKVKNMYGMFQGTSAVSLDLSTWNTSNCTSFGSMFADTYSLKNLNLSGWDTTKATDMSYMFAYGNALETVTLGSKWSFKGASSTQQWAWAQLQDGNWKHQESGNVYTAADLTAGYDGSTMSGTYEMYVPAYAAVYGRNTLVIGKGASAPATYNSKALTEEWSYNATGQDIENIDCSSGPPWEGYQGAWGYPTDVLSPITSIQIIDEIAPVDTSYWFLYMNNITTLDVSKIKTHNTTYSASMFSSCTSLTSLDVTGFDTRNITDMSGMFGNCSNLTSLDLSGFNTANVTIIYGMFSYCSKLTSIDLSSFETSNVTSMEMMFENCSSLTTIYASDLWNTDAVKGSAAMFRNCTKLRGDIAYNSSYTDKTYAKTSGGYLTYKAAPV